MQKSLDKRLDCRLVFPAVRSLIVIALPYFQGERPRNPLHPFGKLARFAWGMDYHSIVKSKLSVLVSEIGSFFPGSSCKIFCDDGPVAEKYWAVQAGLGWIGKNSLLITPEYGSWVVIGVIMTDLDLEPDSPLVDRCGDCRLCLDNCPTSAIVEPRIVHAGRCISYWNIESRKSPPEEQRSQHLGWIFGCDRCQEVCPKNRKIPERSPGKAFYENSWKSFSPGTMLAATDGEVRRFFHQTSLQRLGRIRLLCNLLIAMGNQNNPSFIPFFRQARKDSSPEVQDCAAWAFRRLS